MTPLERAQKSVATMFESDNASKHLGMEIVEVDEGRAVVRMKVTLSHVNGINICHGGMIFSLADTAFAFACNSRNQATVAQHNSITYIRAGQLGDTLTATAEEIQLIGRSGLTDVTVRNQHGETVAEFRGASRAIKGQLFDEEG